MAVLLGLVGKVKFAELHGNLSQQQRVKALADFESGESELSGTFLAERSSYIQAKQLTLSVLIWRREGWTSPMSRRSSTLSSLQMLQNTSIVLAGVVVSFSLDAVKWLS